MSEYTFIGDRISFPAIRDYIFAHKIDEGDTIVLHPADFEALVEEIKNSEDGMPDFPLKLLKVIITQDTTGSVPHGKIQIVKNEKPY